MVEECPGTRVLRIRFNKEGEWYRLHPAERDLERFLAEHGGSATVKLKFLLTRDSYADVLNYYPAGGRHA